jgi:cholesterol oxidase
MKQHVPDVSSITSNSGVQRATETEFDAIVVGSGYGGSVSAYRLAEAGLRVAILETGYAHKAPNIPRGEASEWNPGKGRFGPHTITHLSKDVTAWTGTALGGGSMVNAAVMIRKDNFENWPGGITRQSLDPYYDRAEMMLGAKVYPLRLSTSPYADTTKSHLMLSAAEKLGVPAVMPPVAITYLEAGEAPDTVKVNQFGAEQQGCRRCGECSLPGCNYQAKNSLDFNYLFAAQKRFGARVFTGQKVDRIEPTAANPNGNGGYKVKTIDSKSGAVRHYQAKIVVVSAGCVGSSELLLRNKEVHSTLPALSDRLGAQYTTNGTFIGFVVRAKEDVDPSGGPEITAGLDFNGPDGLNQGHLMFDGSFRGFSYDTFYITGRLVRLRKLAIKLISGGFKLAEKLKLVQPETTLPLLVIGRDNAVGSFSLNKEGRIQTDLNPQDNRSFYRRANEHLKAFTRAMHTRFLRFPLWSLQSKIDVPHNLGGVPMGNSVRDGVVDHLGRVFGYNNLLVLDGSIIPATMGANPALTIAALAERSMEAVIAQYKQDGAIKADNTAPPAPPAAVSLNSAFQMIHQAVLDSGPGVLPLPDALRNKTVLWTPGILARHMGNHSKHVLARLRKMGLFVLPTGVNTDIATAENVAMLKRMISTLVLDEGQGILMGHSRGGVMNLDAYRQLSAPDKAKISHIILVQSPINGTALADFVLSSKLLRRVVAIGSRIIFGNDVSDTVRELSTRGREVAQRALPPLTPDDLAKICTLRSLIGPKESPSFELTRAILKKHGHQSDGVTPYEISEIPGTQDITLWAYDHENMVIQEPTLLKRLTRYSPHKHYEAGNVVEALLRVVSHSLT